MNYNKCRAQLPRITLMSTLLFAIQGCANLQHDPPPDQRPVSEYVNSEKHVNGTPASEWVDAAILEWDFAGFPPEQDEYIPKLTIETPQDGGDDIWERIRSGFTLAHIEHPRINAQLDWITSHQQYLDRVVARAGPYLYYIVEEIERRGVPLELALLPVIESAYQPFAYSRSGAAGLWQFIPSTGRLYGLKQNWWYDGRRDVFESTRAALDYLEKLNVQFDGDWLLAAAAYNWGQGNVKRAIRRNAKRGKPTDFWSLRLPRETRSYVPRWLAVAWVVADPEKYQLKLASIPNKLYFDRVDVGGQLDLARAADMAGITLEELYLLNPAFNRWASDPAGPHHFLIPVERVDQFKKGLSELPPEDRVAWERHLIRRGETLAEIARRYQTTVTILQQSNGIRGSLIRAGDSLMIPVSVRSLDDYVLSADVRRALQAARPGRTKQTHVVRKGDSLWSISRRYRVSMHRLADWNGIALNDVLRPGQRLTIRGGAGTQETSQVSSVRKTSLPMTVNGHVRYTVRRGDSLWKISRRFNVGVGSLLRWNELTPEEHLQPGQILDVYTDEERAEGSG